MSLETKFCPPDPARTLEMILGHLFDRMREVFGRVPDDYLVVDVETSGFDPKRDYVLQIGHCLVRGLEVADRGSFFLDWTQAVGREVRASQTGADGRTETRTTIPVDDGNVSWLQERIAQTGRDIVAQGKQFHTTWDRLLTTGVEPTQVLEEYRSWFEELQDKGWFLVTHNGYAFDVPFFEDHFRKFLGLPGPHFGCQILDTGAVLKAAQIPTTPRQGETPKDFARRVHAFRRKGLRWALSEYAVPLFGLAEKHGLDAEQAHDAGYDAHVTHLLFEQLRELAAKDRVSV